jgi:hypothetical protein
METDSEFPSYNFWICPIRVHPCHPWLINLDLPKFVPARHRDRQVAATTAPQTFASIRVFRG